MIMLLKPKLLLTWRNGEKSKRQAETKANHTQVLFALAFEKIKVRSTNFRRVVLSGEDTD